jgi:NAD(P) transhydrogenase
MIAAAAATSYATTADADVPATSPATSLHPDAAGGNGNGAYTGDFVANAPLVQATLESGKTLRAETLLFAVGRQGTTSALKLEKAGLVYDDRERLKVNANFQTTQPHIYAVGDVIGFPALASTAMEQGRLAVCHAFGVPTSSIPELFPYGIYAIPEISMVGKTEAQLTEAGIPYEAGIAQYKELARGQLLGDETGMLKMLIHQQTGQILGVHAIGTGATELIHIGQAVMTFGGTVDYFINNVFNFPTLAEAYKVAALNGVNKLRHM